MIKSQDRHLRDAVEQGDSSHVDAATAMKGRWKSPVAGMGWYRDAKRHFAALPDD